MADEQNREPENAADETFVEEQPVAASPRHWLSRRNVLIALGVPLLLVLIVAVIGFLLVQNGYVGRYIERQFVAQMDKIGVRTEIGSFQQTFAPLGVLMRDVKLYDKETNELLAQVNSIKLDATVTDLLAPNLRRNVRLDATEIDGLEAWVRFDANGVSNFSRLKIPEQEESNLTFAYSTMKFSLKNSIVHYGDLVRKLSGDARNVALIIEPDEGRSETEAEIENRRFKFDLTATNSNFTVDDKPIEPVDISVRGVATETYADIAELKLKTPFTDSVLKGRLENWEKIKYRLEVVSSVNLQTAGETFKLEQALRGNGNFDGVIEGEEGKYTVNGSIQSDSLAADNIYLKGLNVNASVSGENDSYNANGKVIADMLTYDEFQLDRFQIAGQVMGTGTDFRWLGDLRAASARVPGGTIGNLILADATAEYQDKKLNAQAGTISASNIDAFDAKIRNLRTGRTIVSNANGETKANIASLKADSVAAEGANLRGVNASNVRVQNRGSATNVAVGTLNAQNIQAEGANLRGVNAGDIRIESRGNSTDVAAGNLTAQNLQAEGANVNDLRAGKVTAQVRGNSVTANARNVAARNVAAQGAKVRDVTANDVSVRQNGSSIVVDAQGVTAGNVTATGANVDNLRAGNVDVAINGGATNIDANNVQIGGVKTSAATLGSINIAGVRLRIVGGRVEGDSTDINAGNIALARTKDLPDGGNVENVRLAGVKFELEPSGRYRASADLSLGGGVLGKLNLGAARANVTATDGAVNLQNLNAAVLYGSVIGSANIVYEGRAASQIDAQFTDVDVAKILALSGGQIAAINGKTSGAANLTFPGLNYRAASGTLKADVVAEARRDGTNPGESVVVPITGAIGVRGESGNFNIEKAQFNTGKTNLTASGSFDLNGTNSDLTVAVNSSDASELQRLISALNVAPDVDAQLNRYNVKLDGAFIFKGKITGNLLDPDIDGNASLDSIISSNGEIGGVSNINIKKVGKDIATRGVFIQAETDGGEVGKINFDLTIPNGDANRIGVKTTIDNVNLGGILAVLPPEIGIPEFLRRQNVKGRAFGEIALTGFPNQLRGFARINVPNGLTISGERFDELAVNLDFPETNDAAKNPNRIENLVLADVRARAGTGTVAVVGNYNGEDAVFNVDATGNNIELARLRPFLGASPPDFSGVLDFKANGKGEISFLDNSGDNASYFDKIDYSTFNVSFSGAGKNLVVNQQPLGEIGFNGTTANGVLDANIMASLRNGETTQQQMIVATIDFKDRLLPFSANTELNEFNLTPFAALVRGADSEIVIGGVATGTARAAGTLRVADARGNLNFSTANIRGAADIRNLRFQAQDVVLASAEPFTVEFSPTAATINNARFTGSGTDFRLNGTAVFAGAGSNNLGVNGTLNLRILNALSNNQFFGGTATVDVDLSGTSTNANLIGTTRLNNATFTTIVSNERLTATNINGQLIFNADRAQIQQLEGRIGGGTVRASGGLLIKNLGLESFRLNLRADDITAPLPSDFRTTGDAEIEISGAKNREGTFDSLIRGSAFATRIAYTKDFEVTDIFSSRQSAPITGGTGDGAIGVPKLDLQIIGRDALVVRNNIADVTGSIDVRVTGDTNEPIIAGRVTANGGNIVLLNEQRYDIRRATIDFPAQLDASPIVSFLGEADINGYQIILEANGEIYDTSRLVVNVRSNPSLPQTDVVSLITTGSLSNADGGIPTLAQTGLNTAAGVITDALINQPIRKATDRLFGLNRFEIDPVLAGQRGITPGARLTVGRQINRNLLITYSTNLSNDRNQILALEYRVSNKLSFVAQYEQASLSNVTRRGDNFSFEVRFRRRF